MTDQIPADDLRGFIARYRTAANGQGSILLDELEALLSPPPRPTLADMTRAERAACQWMLADVKGRSARYVIATPSDRNGLAGLVSADGGIEWTYPERITPRPDLPRMEWPSDKKADDVPPVKAGDVIESADDPRLDALPVGTVLRDLDGEEVTKVYATIPDPWRGVGYVPIAGDGTEFGPWTVARLPKKADPAPAPALPDGWRLADHKGNGRVIVTNPNPNSDGRVYYVLPADTDHLGFDWLSCTPDRLTYIDQEADQ